MPSTKAISNPKRTFIVFGLKTINGTTIKANPRIEKPYEANRWVSFHTSSEFKVQGVRIPIKKLGRIAGIKLPMDKNNNPMIANKIRPSNRVAS